MNQALSALSNSINVTKGVLIIRNPIDEERAIQEHVSLLKNQPGNGNLTESQLYSAARAQYGLKAEDLAKNASDMARKLFDATNQYIMGKKVQKNSLTYNYLRQSQVISTKPKEYIFVELQYNPASIRVTSSGGKYMEYDRGGSIGSASNSALVEKDMPATKNMTFEFYLDDYTVDDAFSFSANTSLTAANIIASEANMISKARGIQRSVKNKVEALIGLLSMLQYQDAFFCYGKMIFHGQIINVNAKYTMFNKLGNPIRATVQLGMLQLSGSENGLYAEDTKVWKSKYARYFSS